MVKICTTPVRSLSKAIVRPSGDQEVLKLEWPAGVLVSWRSPLPSGPDGEDVEVVAAAWGGGEGDPAPSAKVGSRQRGRRAGEARDEQHDGGDGHSA
jgi:hypothetical protein